MPDSHVFDRLDEWSALSDDEITALFSSPAAKIARQALKELCSADEQSIEISKENFANVVRQLREAKRDRSRALGEAIIEASELMEQGNRDQAIAVYRKFLDSCSSSFFRQIAMDEMKKISPPNAKP